MSKKQSFGAKGQSKSPQSKQQFSKFAPIVRKPPRHQGR
jgi:hypothetical protein